MRNPNRLYVCIELDRTPTGIEALIIRAVEGALSYARALVKS